MRMVARDGARADAIKHWTPAYGGGFNRSTQHIRRTSQPVFCSLESFSGVRSTSARSHPGWPVSTVLGATLEKNDHNEVAVEPLDDEALRSCSRPHAGSGRWLGLPQLTATGHREASSEVHPTKHSRLNAGRCVRSPRRACVKDGSCRPEAAVLNSYFAWLRTQQNYRTIHSMRFEPAHPTCVAPDVLLRSPSGPDPCSSPGSSLPRTCLPGRELRDHPCARGARLQGLRGLRVARPRDAGGHAARRPCQGQRHLAQGGASTAKAKLQTPPSSPAAMAGYGEAERAKGGRVSVTRASRSTGCKRNGHGAQHS